MEVLAGLRTKQGLRSEAVAVGPQAKQESAALRCERPDRRRIVGDSAA
jgi:hypothetical protein